MGLFARKMEKYASSSTKKKNQQAEQPKNKAVWDWDYESFVDVSRAQQQEAVREVLLSMLPPGAPAQFRRLFPPTRWACEFNAALTVPFFHWLVGPSEVIEVEVDGVRQRSGVRIKKCRYLENSGCVGMCVNMCKVPTQDFFTNEFGLPLTMNPNFEDMSCEMIYGQVPRCHPPWKRTQRRSSLAIPTSVPFRRPLPRSVPNFRQRRGSSSLPSWVQVHCAFSFVSTIYSTVVAKLVRQLLGNL